MMHSSRMTSLPPLSLADVCGPSASARARQFDLLDAALSSVGYAYLDGHGIPADLTTELFGTTRDFFTGDPRIRHEVAQPEPQQVRGWSGVGSESMSFVLDEESHGDLKEKMDIGPLDITADDADPYTLRFVNLWPRGHPGFRPAWEEYYRHQRRIGAALLSLTAEGFDLPRDHFEPLFTDELSMLRALFFPEQVAEPLPHQFRAGTHTDYGAFTIVCAESTVGGLQVFDPDGEWLEIATSPSRLVILVGDLLAEWTANRWPVTVHRTVNPPRSVAFESSRLSFAFYQHPSYSTAITELPALATRSGGYTEELLAGPHLVEKYVRQTTFDHFPRR